MKNMGGARRVARRNAGILCGGAARAANNPRGHGAYSECESRQRHGGQLDECHSLHEQRCSQHRIAFRSIGQPSAVQRRVQLLEANCAACHAAIDWSHAGAQIEMLPSPSQERSADTRNVVVSRLRTSFGDMDTLIGVGMQHAFPPHFHEVWAIGVIDAGVHRLQCHQTEYILTAGNAVVIPPGIVHTGEPIGRNTWSYRMLYPPEELIVAALGSPDRTRPGWRTGVFADAGLNNAIDQVFCAANAPDVDVRDQAVANMFTALNVSAGISRAEEPPTVSAVEFAKDYLATHYAERVRVDVLAKLAGIDPFQLIRAFRRTLGITPHAYLRQIRVSRARRMMRRGTSISTVALSAGFSDHSHLTRVFKDVVGVPPRIYLDATCPPPAPRQGPA
jgi:AraC-like DNA-binding protein